MRQEQEKDYGSQDIKFKKMLIDADALKKWREKKNEQEEKKKKGKLDSCLK